MFWVVTPFTTAFATAILVTLSHRLSTSFSASSFQLIAGFLPLMTTASWEALKIAAGLTSLGLTVRLMVGIVLII